MRLLIDNKIKIIIVEVTAIWLLVINQILNLWFMPYRCSKMLENVENTKHKHFLEDTKNEINKK